LGCIIIKSSVGFSKNYIPLTILLSTLGGTVLKGNKLEARRGKKFILRVEGRKAKS
jgi:hypothetical protein